jgi:limonene-1,2-epoxide hydrolase
MDAFRAAVEARDDQLIEALLAPDVVFTSPVAFTPYKGKPMTAAILRAVMRVFQDFEYVRQIDDGRDHVLVFTARVGERELTGADFIRVNDEGLIDDFMVMVRPLSAAQALADAMAAQFDQVKREVAGGPS